LLFFTPLFHFAYFVFHISSFHFAIDYAIISWLLIFSFHRFDFFASLRQRQPPPAPPPLLLPCYWYFRHHIFAYIFIEYFTLAIISFHYAIEYCRFHYIDWHWYFDTIDITPFIISFLDSFLSFIFIIIDAIFAEGQLSALSRFISILIRHYCHYYFIFAVRHCQRQIFSLRDFFTHQFLIWYFIFHCQLIQPYFIRFHFHIHFVYLFSSFIDYWLLFLIRHAIFIFAFSFSPLDYFHIDYFDLLSIDFFIAFFIFSHCFLFYYFH